MLYKKRLVSELAVANRSEAMEADTIKKNGQCLKNYNRSVNFSKNYFLRLQVTTFALLFAMMNVQAQEGFVRDFGSNPTLCQKNLMLYQSDYKEKNYDAAIVNWRKVWSDCPLGSPNLTLHGTIMYKHFIEIETPRRLLQEPLDKDKRNALIDTLMQVWEKGIKLRPEAESYKIGYAHDMRRYSSGPESQDKLLKIHKDLIDVQKERTTAVTYAHYISILFDQNRNGRISDEDFLDEYNRVIDQICEVIKKTTDEKIGEDLARARDMFEEMIIMRSTAIGCENIIKIYGDKYEENKNDAEFLRKLTRMLTNKDCNSDLREKAVEQQFALNPTSYAAYCMALLSLRRENFEKVVEYSQLAIATETNSFDKAQYNYMLGSIMLKQMSHKTYNELAFDVSFPSMLLSKSSGII